jgi:hypothetical protein
MDRVFSIDLPLLDKQTLKQLILNMAEAYQASYSEEIRKMTEIIDPATTIKKPASESDRWKALLKDKWQSEIKQNAIDDAILQLVVKRSVGNPLLALGYFV